MLTPMEKLAVLETFRTDKPAGFDHVLSFTIGNGDSYPENYIDEEGVNALYDDAHLRLMAHLERLVKEGRFVYRDVDLLWCFKKKMINYVFFIELRYRIFKMVMAQYHFKKLYLENLRSDPDHPDLSFIVGHSPFKQTLSIEKLGPPPSPSLRKEIKNGKLSFVERIAMGFSKGNLRRAKVALFSDSFKSSNVLDSLAAVHPVLYSDTFSPRSIAGSIYKKYSVYQADHKQVGGNAYLEKSKQFIEMLEKTNLFNGFSVSDLSWSSLLQEHLRRLFERQLPKLLFDIDALHLFYSKAQSLSSCLLDEDVAPTKNAFCQLAQKYGIVTYVESHGALGTKGSSLPLTADKIFVWGKAQKEKLIRWGCEPERIIVSGRSLYSSYRTMNLVENKKKVLGGLGLDPSKKIVLIGFFIFRKYRRRLFENSRREMIREIFEVITKYKDVQFILKVKGKMDDNKEVFQSWVDQNGLSPRVKVVDSYDPLKLIMACDVLIAHKTTFAIDGFAMGKPVISFHDPSSYHGEEFRKHKAFYDANSKEELEGLIDKLLASGRFQIKDHESAQNECLNYHDEMPEKIIATHLKK